ncbi:unnamed protein product [Rhizopus stolonifer]
MSHSPEFSKYYSEEEKVIQPTPKIKLKLKLNPSSAPSSEKKHKKKHKKKNRQEEGVHPTLGGKRPYASLQESYHPTDTNQLETESFESEDEYDYQLSKEHIPQLTPRLGRPPKRRSSSMKSNSSDKPKKRGRPTNKAKAAALLAQLPPKIPENPKRDLKTILTKLLENLQKRDTYGFFLEPVDPNFVPDYLKVIKSPMDFSTMNQKLNNESYKTVDDFRQDFNLIVGNTKIYNAIDTIYWKSADKLYEVGSKLLDKAEKQYEEEMALAAVETKVDETTEKSWIYERKESLIKEEDVDIMGIDTHVTLNKKKKKKMAEAGIVFAPDGSLHAVGAVSDLATLLPLDNSFCEPPQLVSSNPGALPSVFYLNRQSVDDFFRNKHQSHSAHFLDYGPFTTLGQQPPGAFYTAQDASYIYPLFGDDRGEAYMKSIWQFLDLEKTDPLTEIVQEKSNLLTRGAWSIVKQVLKRKNENLMDTTEGKQYETIHTEFGSVEAASIVDKLEQKFLPEDDSENQSTTT